MARNKTPEVTVNRILDAASKLFLTKGYEHTTIQDIIDALGDLSKGAIYHHFKSKEEIMERVAARFDSNMEEKMTAIRDASGLTGLEKIRHMLYLSLGDPEQRDMVRIMPSHYMDTTFIMAYLQNSVGDLVERFIEPVIRQGVEDGSIQTAFPHQLAEVFMILCNVWINPFLFPVSEKAFLEKIRFAGELLIQVGMPLLDDELKKMIVSYRELREIEKLEQ